MPARGFLIPHIPFLLPELGGDKLLRYVPSFSNGLKSVREELINDPPDVILISSPHFLVESFAIGISSSFTGNLENFRRPDLVDIRKSRENIAEQIYSHGENIGFIAEKTQNPINTIDYGTMVSLRLIDPEAKLPIIPISTSLATQKEHYLWGKFLREIVDEISDNAVFISTTELTQDFSESPNAFPVDQTSDLNFLDYLISHNLDGLLGMSNDYFGKTENELKPVFTLSGFSNALSGEVIDYSGIIGCGSAIVKFRN